MSPIPLPVDAFIDPIREALNRHRAAVLTAAPGAGKTTRVPPALVDQGRVLLLQPRRVAARAMARRIADERGWTLGREVGWHIRFEKKAASDTQLLVVTEGILTAYLQDDPLLSDVTTLVVDEFHERSIHADLGLALARQAWLARPELRILVMSATLDTAPVARFLGGCPVIDVPGTLHPLSISYASGQSVATALDELLPVTRGNALCFLPGAGEIARAIRETEPVAARHGVELLSLHGSMDAAGQDAALSPSSKRRVILATNIAETSLTVPDVSIVIDTGLHKVARYNGERGVDSLTLERITTDSADQRAGRAGRLGPGTVTRLWDQRDRLRPHREPEVQRIDLAQPVLSILGWGGDPATFEWFERPSDDRLAVAVTLLERLGLVRDGRATEDARLLRRLPLHPRLARILVDGLGSFEAAAACAWLSEPGRTEGGHQTTSCDLLPILDAWARMPFHLKRIADNLERSAAGVLGNRQARHIDETAFRRAVLAGYPDRVAKRRSADRVTLATGHGAVMGSESGVREGDWLVALDVTAGSVRLKADATLTTEATVRSACRIEAEWLGPTRSEVIHSIDISGVVRAHATDWYDALVLRERHVAIDPVIASQMLAQAWCNREHDADTERLVRRATFAGHSLDLSGLAVLAAAGANNLKGLDIAAQLPWATKQAIERDAPDSLAVPSGRSMRLDYAADGTVSVAVKLQELFGLAETPKLGPKRIPVTFHLLAPNARPVQSTQDLKSFWATTYQEVRKELRGRYPRHPWPEDPWTATPTHRTTKRLRQGNRS
ncbi:MAG: ATP-dependent helicase C-terminal domain-containing protein [Acidobacteriota bacterium]|nr:ATP-dependent helicase C-terminal domain-containing protein [Acidobacteriota bacterium]